MKIVNIMGGLGNQMFEYAFAKSLQIRYPNEEVLVDTSHYGHIFFKRYKGANLHNGSEIHKVFPNADIPVASPWKLLKVTWYMPNYVLSRIVRRVLPVRKTEVIQPESENFAHKEEYYNQEGNCYYEGIWESAKNYIPIRKEIQHLYAHPKPNETNAAYIKDMEGTDSVGMHIRRGDYLKVPEFIGICDIDYYRRSIAELLMENKKYSFYIFSNDINWCKENISPLLKGHNIVFVTENTGANSCWDMFLMTHCKNLIIANSSFSWWGAFLNTQNAKVIAPNKWFNRDGVEFDVWLDDWIRL